ncbi:transportin-3-like isoform X2 [Zophobas morio]|uniref:transportin-3-like isoform X2 n=1 Tax=Zophobas morio TaxID=2755281 RepID=UPI003082D9AE
MPTVQKFIEAVNTLFDPKPDNSSKKEAQAWIKSMQESPDAWDISASVLKSCSEPKVVFLAAQTMRTKIKYDFYEFPKDSYSLLRESLFELIRKHKHGPTLGQLACAIADLIIYMPHWETPLSYCIDKLGHDRETLPCLLEIIYNLTEELLSDSLRITTRRLADITVELKQYGDDVLQLLGSCLGISDLHKKVLSVYSSWLEFGAFKNDSLLSSQIFFAPIEALATDHLFDEGVSCVCNLIYASDDSSLFAGVISALLPRVMNLIHDYHKAVSEDDKFRQEGYVKIFTELGVSYLDLILASSDGKCAIQVILECSQNTHFHVSELTFRFWNRFVDELRNRPPADGSLVAFGAYLDYYLLVLLKNIRLSNSHTLDCVLGESEDFAYFRQQAGDLLYSLARLLGWSKPLHVFYEELKKTLRLGQMLEVEASLYSLASIARLCPAEEAVILPELTGTVAQLLSAEDMSAVKSSSLYLLGELGIWLTSHPGYLAFMFSLCCRYITDNQLAPAAADAVYSICTSDPPALIPCIDSLVHCLSNIAQNFVALSFERRMKCYRAVGCVLSRTGGPNSPEFLFKITSMLVHPVLARINALTRTPQPPDCRPLQDSFDSLSMFFDDLRLEEPEYVSSILQVAQSLWPGLLQSLHVYQASDYDVEKWTRCVKYMLRAVGRKGAVFLPDLTNAVVSVYEHHHHSSLLYMAAVTVEIFGRVEECRNGLLSLTLRLCESTMQYLVKQEGNIYDSHYLLVEDYFHLLTRCAGEMTAVFLPSRIASEGFRFAVTGLQGYHKNSFQAAIDYIRQFLRPLKAPQQGDINLKTSINNILLENGQHLVFMLVQCVSGSVPQSCLPHVSSLLYELLNYCRSDPAIVGVEVFKRWLLDVFSAVPGGALPDSAREEFLGLLTATTPQLIEDYVFELSYRFVGRNQLIA